MTCFNPKTAKWRWQKVINEKTGEVYETKVLNFLPLSQIEPNTPWEDDVLEIPCGKCAGCRIDQANDWATRAYLESTKYKKNAFITLTYNNENIPKNRTLIKRDLQLFWKRLRKSGEDIRYIACGEYGPTTLRPHYHAIIYNYWPEDAVFFKKNLSNDYLFTSEKLNKIWGKGYTIIGHVTYETAAYVARYVYKKAFGLNKQWNIKHGRTPEFTLSSRRPGIGANGFEDKTTFEKIKRNMGVFVPTKEGPKLKKIPNFIKNKWRNLGDRIEYFKLNDERARELKRYARTLAEENTNNYFQQLKQNTEISEEKYKILDKRKDL